MVIYNNIQVDAAVAFPTCGMMFVSITSLYT